MQEALEGSSRGTHAGSQAALDQLIDILDLEELDLNLFRGRSPQEDTQRVFGGQVAGQALVAAGRTIEGRRVHSLHAYFLRAGDPRVPIIYQVDRLRDGRSFATRRVTGIQHGRAIFALAASFQIEEESDEHQAEMPETPDPETLPAWEQHIAEMEARGEPIDDWMRRSRPIDTRVVDLMDYAGKLRQEPCQRVWFKADGKLPDDPLLHQCVAAYASERCGSTAPSAPMNGSSTPRRARICRTLLALRRPASTPATGGSWCRSRRRGFFEGGAEGSS